MISAEMTPAMSMIVADPGGTLLALDFDGTLAHIVDDPETAFGHAHAVDALSRLGARIGRVAIVTGRPVHQVLELGGFIGRAGLEHLVVCGQYGAERWDAADGAPPPSELLTPVREAIEALPRVLSENGFPDARIESKGLAVAVHTRGVGDGAHDRLIEPLGDLASRLGLIVELGREVIELRLAGWDKGRVVEGLVREFDARHIVFAGDDLGDLPAFDAVDRLRERGHTGILICSASTEQAALAARADVVVDGPDGVAQWLGAWADALDGAE
jgi:trehalose 6-phosphate phosphatase